MIAIIAYLICGSLYAQHAVFTKPTQGKGLMSLITNNDRIDAHFFTSPASMLQVLDEGNSGSALGGTLEKAMLKTGCTAGVNGGYFAADANHTPLGLLRHAGKTVTPLATQGFTVAGVLYDTGKELKLERVRALSSSVEKMQEAIQGGPFLIDKGLLVGGLDRKKIARRTFVATDGHNKWCIGVTSALTLHDLATWLAKTGALGNFQVYRALNLDGGTSSAYWDSTDNINLPGFKTVRNYIGIKTRTMHSGSRTTGTQRKGNRSSRKPDR